MFPLDRLRELASEGTIGKLAASYYAFMGHIDGEHIDTLVYTTAKDVAQKLKEDEVEVVLLTPA
ncbi:glycine/sarcosine/betaine reductase selenoprotein B family protein [Malonomonas rubra]|uniref:glycine/sarcosine/betaine reductase selenoprotein B family protein n=1 Tax=Malonomonas rubra TaxID=57040 RepID=UPI0034E96AB4